LQNPFQVLQNADSSRKFAAPYLQNRLILCSGEKNMRIAMISQNASPISTSGSGDCVGQNVYVAQLAQSLTAKGHDVDVFTRRDNPNLPRVTYWKPKIRIINVAAGPEQFVPKEEQPQYMKEFATYVYNFFISSASSYDIIHAHSWMSGWVAAEIKERLRVPFVVTFHALGRVRRMHQASEIDVPEERFEAEERVVREANQIIAECPQEKDDLIDLYGASEDSISVVPGGFDPEEFALRDKGEARERLGLQQDAFIVLHVGRIVPRKGIDNAIRGFGWMFRALEANAQLIIVGSEAESSKGRREILRSAQDDGSNGSELARLKRVAEEEGLAKRVMFVGGKDREELAFYYAAADVFVTTPWYEPFGMTPLEAMASGCPVVGSSVGGVKYSVVNGTTGFLVPPNDPACLGNRLSILCSDSDLREKMAKNALKRAYEHFTWSDVAQSVTRVYNETLEIGAIAHWHPEFADTHKWSKNKVC
jgi:D-inositol-3-phosphate glycosyltransferase